MAQHPFDASGSGPIAIGPGARLTDYTNIDMTVEDSAAGGMGLVVWGPNALRGGKIQALKLLQPQRLAIAPSPAARAALERQFEQEALVWCHLWPHDCVVTANALTRLPGLGDLRVLALEYAPNGSLREQLRLARKQNSALSLRATLAWALHIASALVHIHQPDSAHDRPDPLVHCDLKPENVLLNAHGWAQLTDLGLTRAYAALAVDTAQLSASDAQAGDGAPPTGAMRQALVAQLREELRAKGLLSGAVAAGMAAPLPPQLDAATLLATQTVCIAPTRAISAGSGDEDNRIGEGVAGSPPYMAPEHWRGMAQTVPATDIYAFGVLLYELFAGFIAPHPFPRDPQPYLTQSLYAEALAGGHDTALLAWHAAQTDPVYRRRRAGAEHRERAVGEHRLTDPDALEAALASGPCAELLADASGAGRERAEMCLRRVDELVTACLMWEPTARPSAAALVTALAALAEDPCGLKPLSIPQPLQSTPRNESAFWSNLGVVYSRLGQEEQALIAKRRSVDHEPNDPINWVNLGASLAEVGQVQRNEARQAEARMEMAEAARLMARARATLEEALAAYQQARARIAPEYVAEFPALPAGLATNEGSVYSLLERFGDAVAADERALAIAPDRHSSRFGLALHNARWSQEAGATTEEQVARLEAAHRAIMEVLAVAPDYRDGRRLAEEIARALADPAHVFHG